MQHSLRIQTPYCDLFEKNLPTKDSKNQVEHKKRANHNQWNEKDPVENTAQGIVGLQI